VTELLNIVKRDLGINRYESKRMRQDGQLFDVSASLSPVRDLQGNVIGAATITRDITLQRKGEEQLLAYTDQLETLNLVSQEIAGTLLVPDVIERSLRRLVSASGFDIALAQCEQDSAEGKFYGVTSGSHSISELAQIWNGLGPEFEQCFWQCRNAWFVEDVAEAPELASAAADSRIRALAVLPLAHDAPLRAAVALMSTRVHPFGTDEKPCRGKLPSRWKTLGSTAPPWKPTKNCAAKLKSVNVQSKPWPISRRWWRTTCARRCRMWYRSRIRSGMGCSAR
jgi:hypothetical protein